jgi:tubulin polyglutamylase TTLL9
MSEYFRACLKKEYYGVYPTSIKFRSSLKNTIYEALKRRQWKETEGEDFDFNWSEKNYFASDSDVPFHSLTPQQHVNHFPNNYELTRKDMMYKNLKLFKKELERDKRYEEAKSYDFFPLTFHMPSEFTMFVDEYKHSPGTIWIMKPAGKAQGKGIFLVTSLNQLYKWKNSLKGGEENAIDETYVCQRYIYNPLLLGGKKFDMRVYALVTCYNPLTAYLYRTGFCRFTSFKYSLNPEDLNNNQIHLTNVAVQKQSATYDKQIGGKWYFRELKTYLMGRYNEEQVNSMFDGIQNIIIKCFYAVQSVIAKDRHCFELYGYDILIDENLKPWLIEINSNASLTASTERDAQTKIKMLDDLLTIVDLEKIMTGNEDQVGGWDIICRGTPIKMNNNCMYKTRLGSFNNREKQLKQLAKQTATRLANLYMQKKKGVSGNNNYSSNISSSASSNKDVKRYNNNRNYSNVNKPYQSKRDK